MRRGIISAGNRLADTVKFIPTFSSPGNLVTIEKVEIGFGGCSHNALGWDVHWTKMKDIINREGGELCILLLKKMRRPNIYCVTNINKI